MPALAPERLTAPREDGAVLSRPPLVQGVELARANAENFNASEVAISGVSLPEFRVWTRKACLEGSRRWMSANLGIEAPTVPEGLLFITGHQPQLNHAGVRMKNVAIARLAECCGGQGLNLIVDNDLAGPPAIRCPAGTSLEPRFAEIPFDDVYPTQPWEELHVENRELFTTFSQRVAAEMSAWSIDPALSESWSSAVETLQRTDHLAALLSASRVSQERRWHIKNLELPVSELCRTEPFLAFVSHLCRNFERLFANYNQAVHDYRRKYGVRNSRHPVPDLEQVGDRFELPFWYWEPGDHDRTRLFVKRSENFIELFAGERLLTRLAADSHEIAPLVELQKSGRLRTRALTTTLFARLCLGDLFIHGIGGARYDEITDGIMQSFFGMAAPGFVTLTATLHLPLESYQSTSSDVARLKNEIRHLQFSGADESTDGESLRLQILRAKLLEAAKRERDANPTKAQRRARRAENRRRHLELMRIQQELAALADSQVSSKENDLAQLQQEVRANSVLKSREFAACLFPEAKLRSLVEDVRRQICGRA